MTNVGLQYLAHKEQVRSNKQNELLKRQANAETRRANLANEAIKSNTLDETVRSNTAREAETQRSNLAREYHDQQSLYENSRQFAANYSQKEYWNQINANLDLLGHTIESNKMYMKAITDLAPSWSDIGKIIFGTGKKSTSTGGGKYYVPE